MKVAIFGTGSMGSFFAMRLHDKAGVTVIGTWKEQIEALNHQLTLLEQDGSETKASICAKHISEIENEKFDLILLLVKSRQTETIAEKCREILDKKSTIGQVLTLQNGAGHLEILEENVGGGHAMVGVTNQAATVLEPGIIRDAGPGAIFLDNDEHKEKVVKVIRHLFEKAGFEVKLQDDIQSLIWSKLAVNAAINPLTAILNVNNGYLGENEPAKTVMTQIAKEVIQVAETHGVSIPYSDYVEEYVASISKATYVNYSSMLRDVLRNVPTEIEAITGYIIKHAEIMCVPTPYVRFVHEQVKRIEAGLLEANIHNRILPYDLP